MAASAKKRDVENKAKENEDVTSSDVSSDEENVDNNDEKGNQIMVDFVGRTPDDSDYHGIKILLQQLFLKAHVNNEECIQQLRSLLKELSSEYATDSVNGMINNILENDSSALGLIINERFVNIPADISVPLLENLMSDMKRAIAKKMAYDFKYYVIISKLSKPKTVTVKKSKKNKNSEEPEDLWSNQEEEVFDEEAMCKFEFSVAKETDTGLSGTWNEDDDELIPYRRVMIFEAEKLPGIIEKIKKFIAH
ncbi:Similar to CG9286: Protein BCCIP homolog (Drosophila melanogaster) [Cotesia congregata]|uniref:Similar to CG9286: Protein BCCIP homolog (Drosophila melanogaster) n=1 Tax=Cotesia congregata TaxID=51543 RepID=A0A8J2ECG6_COTCN|nr:Similar to CG9286: Protein BCCIP homolog (Drosophila melanogaster) [Cotesia congregata]